MNIVLSGVNLVEGGTLQVFKDCITAFSKRNGFSIICLVHSRLLFNDMIFDNIEYIEFPDIKKSWLSRLKFEYFTCKKISQEIMPDIWLSMHDITPRIDVRNLFVYCHNPAPFYHLTYMDFKFNKRVFLFTLFYKYLYKINIKKNKAVIVQQSWIGEYFNNKLKARKILIAKPVEPSNEIENVNFICDGSLRLFYPALSRTFKNFELLLDSLSYLKLNKFDIHKKIKLVLTIDEKTNPYSEYLVKKYSHLENVDFLGVLSRDEVDAQYQKCDVVVFPSKLETWGLPISEAKAHHKPIILADLPYAYETLGNYSAACFVNPDDYIALSKLLVSMLSKKSVFHSVTFKDSPDICFSWESLVDSIVMNSDI